MLTDNGHENPIIILDDPIRYAALTPTEDDVIALVERGSYVADRSVPTTERFRPGVTPYDAVRITKRQLGSFHLAKAFGKSDPFIQTQALARIKETASMSIGSRLLRIEDGILNRFLGAALGTELSLTAMDYDALLDTKITLGQLLDANGQQLGLTAGTYSEIIESDLTMDDFAKALRANAGLSAPANRALSNLIRDNDNMSQFTLSDMIDADALSLSGGPVEDAVLGVEVTALRALTAAALAASGEHQLEFGLALDQLRNASVDVVMAIGEKEKFLTGLSKGSEGSVAETAQTRLSLQAVIGGTGLLSSSVLELPLVIEVATGKATLSEIDCDVKHPERSEATVKARPGLVSVHIGTPRSPLAEDFDADLDIVPATLLKVPTLEVKARGDVEIGNLRNTALTFTGTDIENNISKQVSTRDVAQSLTLSLLENTELEISVLGSTVRSRSLLESTILSQASTLANPLDTIAANLLATMGVSVGEVDVRLHDIDCDRSKLVQ